MCFFVSGWFLTDNFFTWQEGFTQWDGVSERIVIGRMYQMREPELTLAEDMTTPANPAGFMGWVQPIENPDMGSTEVLCGESLQVKMIPYRDGPGIQGTVEGLVNRLLVSRGKSEEECLESLRYLNGWLFVFLTGLVCLWAYKEMGPFSAVLCGGVTLLSQWMLISMGNLYWVMWAYVLIGAVDVWLLRKYENAPKIPWWVCLVITLPLLFRFLCGFEFVSTLLIYIELPVLYYGLKHCGTVAGRKKWGFAFIKLAGMGLFMFALAFGIWARQIFIDARSSGLDGIEHMKYTIGQSTGLWSNQLDYGTREEALATPFGDVFEKYWTETDIFNGLTVQHLVTGYVILCAVILVVLLHRRAMQGAVWHLKMFLINAVALLGPASWFLLARGHSYHYHICYIIWWMPLLPCIALHAGAALKLLIDYKGPDKTVPIIEGNE